MQPLAHRLPAVLVAAALVVVGVTTPRAAELDEVEAAIRRTDDPALRWENLGCEARVVGPDPTRDRRTGIDSFAVGPTAAVTLRLPPGAVVRLTSPDGRLAPADLEVSVSNGSGLYTRLPVIGTSDGGAVLAFPQDRESVLVRVGLAAGCKSRCVAVFAGRRDPLPDLAPYRKEVCFPGKPVAITRCDRSGSDEYWPASPACPLTLAVEGPGRFAVHTRFRYPPGESRVFQFYRVHVGLNGGQHQTLEYETTLEPRFPVRVDGADELVSRAEVAYLEVPAGKHRLTFDPTAPVYVRVLRQQCPDYLAPLQNQPRPTARQARTRLSPYVLRLSPWDLIPPQADRVAAASADFVAEKERLALRLVRENRHREGGLAGTMLLTAVAGDSPDYPRAAEAAEDLRVFHTFYRDLYPLGKPPADPQLRAYFLDRRLTRPGERPVYPSAPHPLTDDILDQGVGSAFFFAVRHDQSLAFPIPDRFSPSDVRVVAAGDVGPFFVQLDDAPPIRLTPGAVLSPTESVPSRGETAVVTGRLSTLDVPFARTRVPAHLLPVGTSQLPLPAGVKQVRVWAESPQPGLRVAVQYRTGKPYRLSETEFLEQYRRGVGTGPIPWSAFVKYQGGEPVAGADPDALRELANQWTPLVRLVRSRHEGYRAAVVAWGQVPAATPAGEKAAKQAGERARSFEQAKEWVAATEAWAVALATATGDARWEALLGRAAALLAQGEQYLGERQLRGAFLHDPDPETRAAARASLEKLYREAGDTEATEALRASAVATDPTAANLSALAKVLLDEGEYELALLAALMPAESDQRADVILRAALRLRWWQLYDQRVGRLPYGQDYWRALGQLARGEFEAAGTNLRKAGDQGRPLLDRVTTAQSIRMQLTAAEPAERVRGVHEWERWQAEHRGPFVWRPEPALAADFGGAVSVYTVDRDLLAEFFVATPDRPLRVRAAGPVKLRFEVRPLHPAGSTTPLDGWLRLTHAGRQRLLPFTNNLPTQGLQVVGMPKHLPGMKVEPWPEVQLGPGVQEFEVSAERGPVLVRVYAERPEFDPGVLPPITPETLPALLRDAGSVGDDAAVWKQVEAARPRAKPSAEAEVEALVAKGQLLAALVKLSVTDADTAYLRMVLLLRLAETDPKQRAWAQAHGEALFAAHPTVPGLASAHGRLTRNTTWEPITAVRESAGVRQVDVSGWNPEGPALRSRTALLRPVAPGEQLVFGTERLVLSLVNKQATTVQLTLEADDAAHLPPLPLAAAYQVTDGQVQKVPLKPGTPASFELPLAAGPAAVRVWVEGPPVLNQFLRVKFSEGPDAAAVMPTARRNYQVATRAQPLRVSVEGPAWVRADERRADGSTRSEYRLVAKDREVVEFAPPDGQAEAIYRVFRRVAVPDEPTPQPRIVPLTSFPVPPPLVTAPNPPVLPRQPGTAEVLRHPLADPAVLPAGGLFVDDAYPLGRQEDGTWSVGGEYRRRQALLEDLLGTDPLGPRRRRYDEFGEVRATHRYFDEWNNRYSETTVLGRWRDGGNPSFGLTRHERYDPDGSPYTFHLNGEFYMQTGRDYDGVRVDHPLWSAFGQARVARRVELTPKLAHEPSAALFGRLLNTGENSPLQGRTDIDVFTRYKAQHRAGWTLADAVTYRPWLDTLLRASGAATSNENFYTVDHIRGDVEWAQLFGNTEVNVGYRLTRFFRDADRDRGVTRHLLTAGLTHDFWHAGRYRVQLTFDVQHEFTRNVTGIQAGLVWHFGAVRRYRDFRPDEVRFRDLRERRAAEMLANNRAWQAD